MVSDEEVRRAAEDVLRELNLDGWQLAVEPALAAPTSTARQLRLHDDAGKEYAVVVDFQQAEDGTGGEDYKGAIRRQVQALLEIPPSPRPR